MLPIKAAFMKLQSHLVIAPSQFMVTLVRPAGLHTASNGGLIGVGCPVRALMVVFGDYRFVYNYNKRPHIADMLVPNEISSTSSNIFAG